MELTDKHIEELYKFTQDHYVDWYDLQTELVDHLANDIEEIWEGDPSLSFEKARDISFKKFGIFGFGEVVEQKQNALSKQYWRMIWKEFVQFFKLPKIMLTVFFGIGTYYLFEEINSGLFIGILFVFLMFVFPILILINEIKKQKIRNSKTDRKWMIDGVTFQSGLGPFIILCPYVQLYDLFTKSSFTTNQLLFLTVTFVLFTLTFYISHFIVRPNMLKKMEELFPEYGLG